MVSVFDVAAFVVARTGAIRPMKLQKLVYYGQAWSLVRDKKPLFPEKIEAWRYGPVCAALYQVHRGADVVPVPYPHGDPTKLPDDAARTMNAVLHAYGHKTSRWLSDLTHREDPWLAARQGLPLGARGSVEITHAAMRSFYESADTVERRQMTVALHQANPLVAFIENLSDDDAAIVDELGVLDGEAEAANLSA